MKRENTSQALRRHWKAQRAARLVAFNKPGRPRKAPRLPANNIRILRVDLLKLSQPDFMRLIGYSDAQAKRLSLWECRQKPTTKRAIEAMNSIAEQHGLQWLYAEGEPINANPE